MKNTDRNLKNTFLCCYFTEIRFSPEHLIMLNNNRTSSPAASLEMKLLPH